ncbi:MAG: RNA polymerase sigma-32 factor [Bradymonadia bacterium]|jgi:RNA polymerase sigma-32 factor
MASIFPPSLDVSARETTAAKTREAAYVADPVQRYMSEIRQHQVLTREEEQVLAKRYVEGGSDRDELQLVNSNLRLVVKIALEYQSNRITLLDLIQEGNVGLIHAVRKFDPAKKIRLASYAQWWIRAYILKYLMDNYKLVKVGTTQAQRKLFYNLKREKERLARQGLVATPALLARSLAVRQRDVVEMSARLSGRESSLDAPLQDGERGTLGDVIPSDSAPADELLAVRQQSEDIHRHLNDFASTLEGRDITIWHRRMVAEKPETLQEIGETFGVSRERARQLEARIVRRLSKYLGENVEHPETLAQSVID